jgi:hypothetical protein
MNWWPSAFVVVVVVTVAGSTGALTRSPDALPDDITVDVRVLPEDVDGGVHSPEVELPSPLGHPPIGTILDEPSEPTWDDLTSREAETTMSGAIAERQSIITHLPTVQETEEGACRGAGAWRTTPSGMLQIRIDQVSWATTETLLVVGSIHPRSELGELNAIVAVPWTWGLGGIPMDAQAMAQAAALGGEAWGWFVVSEPGWMGAPRAAEVVRAVVGEGSEGLVFEVEVQAPTVKGRDIVALAFRGEPANGPAVVDCVTLHFGRGVTDEVLVTNDGAWLARLVAAGQVYGGLLEDGAMAPWIAAAEE